VHFKISSTRTPQGCCAFACTWSAVEWASKVVSPFTLPLLHFHVYPKCLSIQVSNASSSINFTITVSKSQNHRMLGVGRDLCGSPSPTPLPKQVPLQQAAQDLVHAGLEYLQRIRLHSLPGQPVPVLRHPQREEVLPHVQLELFPCFSLCPLPLVLSLGTTEKSLTPSS